MVRGTRRIVIELTSLPLLAAITMTLPSYGKSPDRLDAAPEPSGQAVAPAIATSTGGVVTAGTPLSQTSGSAIQQVVGKQPSSQRRRRLDWFGAIGGKSDSAEKFAQPAQVSSNQGTRSGRGLLDGLFSRSGKSGKRVEGSAAIPENPASAPMPEPADWDGVPYHAAQRKSGAKNSSQPIRDPSASTVRSSTTKRESGSIGSGVSRRAMNVPRPRPTPSVATTTARPATSAKPQIVRGTTSKSLPSPKPSEPQVARRSTERLSSSSSSRRQSKTASSSSKLPSRVAVDENRNRRQQIRSDDSIQDLVPRVPRRAIASAVSSKKTTTEEPSKPSSRRESLSAGASPAKVDKPTAAKVAAKPLPTPTADLVAKSAPPAPPEVVKEEPVAAPAKASLAPPIPAVPQLADAGPATTEGPKAAIPTMQLPPKQPYAASQPAVNPLQNGSVAGYKPQLPAQDLSPSPAPVPTRDQTGVHGPRVDAFQPIDPYQQHVTGNSRATSRLQAPTRFAQAPAMTPTLPPAATVQAPVSNSAPAVAQPGMATSELAMPSSAAKAAMEAKRLPSNPMNAFPTTGMRAHTPALQQPMPDVGRRNGMTTEVVNKVRDTNLASEGRANFATRKLQAGETAVATELPSIRVVTHGPGEMMIKQTRQYEIRVENRGSIDAEGVLVRALIPDWASLKGQNSSRGNIESESIDHSERLVWTIDRLPAGKSETMLLQLKAMRSGLYDVDVDWTLVPQRSIAKVLVQQPKLTLTIDGPDEVVFGESETYKVRVLNPGDGVAPDVVFTLSPNSTTPQSQRIGDIPAGKEAQFDVELTAQDLGDLRIHGLAAGDLELRAEANKVIRVSAARIEALLSGPELKYQNTDAVYHLEIENTGTAISKDVIASLELPAGVEYLGGLEGASIKGSQLRWKIDSLSPRANRDYEFRCKMTSTGRQVFAFECRGTAAGQATVDLETSVEAIADLVLSVNDPPAPAPIGKDVTYEIVVRNRGSKEARNVRAIAQFSNGIEPHRVEGQSGEVLTGQVLFDPIDRIAPGQEVRLLVVAKAETSGHHRFRTEVRSGDIVLLAEEATHYMSANTERVSRRSSDNGSR